MRTPSERIVRDLAERATTRIARGAVRKLQGMRSSLLSDEGSGLGSTWDEICVQVQGEHSFFWSTYLDAIGDCVRSSMMNLDRLELEAIWLETDDGFEWSCQDEIEGNEVPAFEGEVVVTIRSRVLEIAADWRNERIEQFFACRQTADHDET